MELAASAAVRWRTLNFWQALALLALCRILFGGFGGHHRGGHNRDHWRKRILDAKCKNMSPEERERFRDNLRKTWGYEPTPDAGKGL